MYMYIRNKQQCYKVHRDMNLVGDQTLGEAFQTSQDLMTCFQHIINFTYSMFTEIFGITITRKFERFGYKP